jgi:predicted Zn-dependent protease
MLNNSFRELVKKYERYNSKRRTKKFLSLLGLAAIIAAGFLLIYNSQYIVESFKKTNPEPVETKTSVTKNKIVKTEIENSKKSEIKQEAKPETKPVERVKVSTPKSEELPNKVYKRETKKIEKTNPFQLEVKERKNLYSLLTKDKEQNSYQSAIDIAKFYFNEKNYKQAVTWSVKASKKDPRESDPWIIYAKSKAHLGKTDVAKKALKIYLKHTESKEVRDLLDTL